MVDGLADGRRCSADLLTGPAAHRRLGCDNGLMKMPLLNDASAELLNAIEESVTPPILVRLDSAHDVRENRNFFLDRNTSIF